MRSEITKKDCKLMVNCNDTYCDYYDVHMELHCAYSTDNSKCVKDITIKRAKEHISEEYKICKAEVQALIDNAVIVGKWMQWWLDNNECDCEGNHICGKNDRRMELEELNNAIQKVSEHFK